MRKTILLVDDDTDIIATNKMILEKNGYNTLTAHNSGDALKLANTRHPDAAIIDVMMDTPDEGFVLARDLRKSETTKKMPLIMLTSVNDVNRSQGHKFRFSDKDRDDAWLPVDRFLDKPVKPETLVSTLQEVLR
jgi:two-component system alkaline phosphatase synthesis response regulator PhoP